MANKREKNEGSNSNGSWIGKIPDILLDALKAVINEEKNTVAGKFNIFIDLLIALLIMVYWVSSTTTAITRIISSIFNHELTPNTSDLVIPLFIIFVVTSFICLAFMHFTSRESKKIEEFEAK